MPVAPVRPTLPEQIKASYRLVRDLGGGLQDLHRQFGPVVDFGFGSTRAIHVFGPEANEHVMSTGVEAFEWGRAMAPLVAVDGPTAIVVSDGESHRRRRRLVQPAFSKRRVDDRMDLITDTFDRIIDQWNVGDRLDAHETFRVGIRQIIVRSMFGEHLASQAEAFGDALEPAIRYVQRNPITRFDHDLGINAYAKALRGCRQADVIVRDEVDRRRSVRLKAAPPGDSHTPEDTPTDVLTALIDGVEGEVIGDDEFCDQVRSLVAAGYDTTAATAAWLVVELGRNPYVLEAVRNEVLSVLGDRTPTIQDLRSMPLVLGSVREALRLWPAGFVMPRWSIAPSELLGFTIPSDRLVLYSPYVTGRMPELWDDPDRFDPTRWLPERPEPKPYSFVTFGGGERRCLGFAMATLELQVLVVRLCQRVDWRLEAPSVRAAGLSAATPHGGVPIEVLSRR